MADLRVSRGVVRRLALVMVLAGLLHLLGCAHGPQGAGMPRSDTPAAAQAAVPPHAHQADETVEARCHHGAGPGCTGVDEPATVSARTDPPAPPGTDHGCPPPHDSWRHLPGDRAPCGGTADEGRPPAHGRTRAALGVWRT